MFIPADLYRTLRVCSYGNLEWRTIIIIIIRFFINMQVQGQYPHQWAPFQVIGLLHAWQISHQISRSLSWQSIAESFHSLQSLSVSYFQVILGLPGPRFPTICMSKAVLTALLKRSMCPYKRSLLSFRMRSRSSMPSRASSSVDLMLAVSCGLTLQICLIIALSFRCRCWTRRPIFFACVCVGNHKG